MKRYVVVFTPGARDHLAELYRYIATNGSPEIAARYTDGVLARCALLSTIPERGRARDDLRPGLRITSYRKRTAIAYAIETERVVIIGVFHGGQDYEALLDASSFA